MPEVLVFSNPPNTREELMRRGYSEEDANNLTGRSSSMADLGPLKNIAGITVVGATTFFGSQFAKSSVRKFFLDNTIGAASGKAFGFIQGDRARVATYYASLAGTQTATGLGLTMLSDWAVKSVGNVGGALNIPYDVQRRMKTSGYVGTALAVLSTFREYMQVSGKTLASVKQVEDAKIAGQPLGAQAIKNLAAYYELGGTRSGRRMGAFFQEPNGLGCCNVQPVGSRVGAYWQLGRSAVPTGEDVVRYALSS